MCLSKYQEHDMNVLGIFLLIKNDFRIGKLDSTLFTRKMRKDLFVYQIYVDDIIFSSTNKSFYGEFKMSMMRVLIFFLGF
jgi:hypothetical protein